jgi:hypothetical protein
LLFKNRIQIKFSYLKYNFSFYFYFFQTIQYFISIFLQELFCSELLFSEDDLLTFLYPQIILLTYVQAVKIQYGQRSEPAQTKPIQNRHNHFKNQSQQTDLRKHFPGETYTTTSNTTNQSLRKNNT